MSSQRFTAGLVAIAISAAVALSGCGGGGASGSSPPPPPAPAATLQTLANQPPVPVFLALLLTDGSIMVQANPGTGPGPPR